ncbi:Pr6Pr family membrane protein [Microbacterium tumbae]
MTWWSWIRFAAAVLGIAAISRQLVLSIGNALDAGSHLPTVVTNFFSYFTILSNLASIIVLLIGAVWLLRHRHDAAKEPVWLGTLLACASTYMIVTGIVYNLLLRHLPIGGLSDVWTNESLHVVIPLVLLLDVLLAPRRRALGWSTVGVIAAFPVVWAVYTLVRAGFITAPATGDPWWYPYPFLDPHLTPGGYLGVTGYVVGIAAVIIGIGLLVVWVGRRRGADVTADAPRR